MYRIADAARRSGVPVPLLRAWERRYAVVRPVRSDAGYRLYSDEDVERLNVMRALVADGWAPREAAARVRDAGSEELGSLAPATGPATPATPSSDIAGEDAPAPLVEAVVDAVRRYDLAALEIALDEAFSTARFEHVAQRILMPALVKVGEAWATGEVDVAAEHAGSEAVMRRLGQVFEAAAATVDSRIVLVGLPAGVRHAVGALGFAVAARRAGMNVVYLGADVPLDTWHSAIDDTRAAAVVLGAVMRRDVPAASAAVSAITSSHPGVLVAVGGKFARRVIGATLTLPEPLAEAVGALAQALAE